MNNTEGDPQHSYTTSETGVLDREALFEQNLEWARAIARNVHRKLPPSFDIDDLTQEAHIALWKRCQLYDPQNERGAPFQGYAYVYIRGACLMHCRRRNWKEATHESLSSSGEAQPAQVLNIKGNNPAVERWSIGRTDTKTLTATDQRANPEQALQGEQEGEIEYGRLVHFFSTIPPPLPEAILLVRTVLLEGAGLDELAGGRIVSEKELAKALNSGVKQLRKFHPSPVLEEFDIPSAERLIRRIAFRNGVPIRFATVNRRGVAARG